MTISTGYIHDMITTKPLDEEAVFKMLDASPSRMIAVCCFSNGAADANAQRVCETLADRGLLERTLMHAVYKLTFAGLIYAKAKGWYPNDREAAPFF